MSVVRELVTKFLFQADTTKVQQFAVAVEQAKAVAGKTAQAVTGMAQSIRPATQAMAAGAQAVGESTKKAAQAVQAAAVVVEAAAADVVVATERMAVAGRESATVIGEGFDVARAKAEGLAIAIRGADGRLRDLNGRFLKTGSGPMPFVVPNGEEGGSGGGSGGGGRSLGALGLLAGLAKHVGTAAAGYFSFKAAEAEVEHYAEHQQNMQKVGSAMLASDKDIGEMNEGVLKLSGVLGMAPRKLSESLMELAGKGFEKAQAMALLPLTAKLARAGLTDNKTATDLLGATQRMYYGNDTSHTGHLADLIARTHEVGGIQLGEMAESQKYAAPAFSALGQSVDSQMLMLAILGQAGITGSSAGNALKSILIKMAAPAQLGKKRLEAAGLGEELKKGKTTTVFKELGIRTDDGHEGIRSPLDVIRQMKQSMVAKRYDLSRQAAAFKDAFGLEDIGQAMALAKLSDKDLEEIRHKLGNVNGSLDRMYKIMNQGLIPAWDRFFAKIEVVAAILLEKLSPGLVNVMDGAGWLIDKVADLVRWFHDATKEGGNLHWALDAVKIAILLLLPFLGAAAIAALPELLSAAGEAITGTLIPAIVSATRACAAFLVANLPLAAVITIFGALVLMVQEFYTWMNGGDTVLGKWFDYWYEAGPRLMAWWDNFWQTFPDPLLDGLMFMVEQFRRLPDAFQGGFKGLEAWFLGFLVGLEGMFETWIDELLGKLGNLGDNIRDTLHNATGLGHLSAVAHAGGPNDFFAKYPGFVGSPALASVTPSADLAARTGQHGGASTVNAPLTAHTTVNVKVGHDATPAQTGHVVAAHVDQAIRDAHARAARQLPRQVR